MFAISIKFDFSKITAIERKIDWLEKTLEAIVKTNIEQKELIAKLMEDIADLMKMVGDHPLYDNVRKIKTTKKFWESFY